MRLDMKGEAKNMVGVTGFGASLELLREFGLDSHHSAIAERVLEITDYAVDRLAGLGATIVTRRTPGHCSGIVSFEFAGPRPRATTPALPRGRCRPQLS